MNTPHRAGTVSPLRRMGWRFAALAIVLGALGAAPSLAQTTNTESHVYRLAKTSTFERGCFPPCLCPVMERGVERGTFVLTPLGSDGLFDKYRVSEVNWTVMAPSGEMQVTGSGTYRVGGEFAVQQQLSLDLKVGDDPAQHFDSGLVAGGDDFPRIEITISIHDQYCFDTVFSLDAAPVSPDQVHPYRLLRQSTFERGCIETCDCPSGSPLPILGTFSLVELDRDPDFAWFAVVMANWRVASDASSTTSAPLPVTGAGSYRIGGEFAGEQQMTLNLKVGTGDPAPFDSGLVPGGEAFPRIDIQISNSAGCIATVIDLHAKPVLSRMLMTPTLAEPSP